jgi:DMSO/TMAO reductase YedYZ molybdopterin-dependent catalytic subunit
MTSDYPLEELARNGLEDQSPPALIPRQTAPDNAEFPLHHWWSWITPNSLFYVRSHFPVPTLDPEAWRLSIEGEVEQPLTLSLDDLRALPRRRLISTLECAGNRRTEFQPPPPGVPWQDGAVSNAEWEGIALAELLVLARPRTSAREVVLEGADQGTVAGGDSPIRFARSLPLSRAMSPHTLLAHRMNGAALPAAHGAPLRAVVPGAYGMDSVKWLVRLVLLDRPFDGYFQANDYRLFPSTPSAAPVPPVGRVRTNSLIAWPGPGTTLPVEEVRVVGYAWTGSGTLRKVDLSVDGGASWSPARLVGPDVPYAWRLWEASWRPAGTGTHSLVVRATDSNGGTQPEQAEWNAKGYANNARHHVEVQVR